MALGPFQNMNCQCSQLPQIFNVETLPNRLSDALDLVEQKDSGWRKLYRCYVCGQHWQLDLIDSLQVNCAIKIDSPGDWQSFDDKPVRMRYVFDVRGGASDEDCIVAGCTNKALRSLAYCLGHAYDHAGIRE